jgi:thiol-disulfide isomerase/thioredoxin
MTSRDTVIALCLAAAVSALPAARADAPHDPAAHAEAAMDPHTGRHDPDSGAELLGRPAPAWTFERWVRGGPLTLEGLRGKVVLVRWWTDGCHYCRTTLPVLESLRREHPGDLVVVGVYHPKPPHDVTDGFVRKVAHQIGFEGALALDRNWTTLNRYWLDADSDRNWTSVSFLIDRQGVIRWVHGGGEYHPSSDPRHARCDVEYQGLRAALDHALAEPATGGAERAQP